MAISREKRSEIMSRVKGKDTTPEMTVRRLLHSLGYRYRLHHKDLPGKPDIVFKSRGKALFVHGCFWHGHSGCRKSALPKTNTDFWRGKIAENIERDARNVEKLWDMGYEVLVVWECETTDLEFLTDKLTRFMSDQE